MGHNIMSYHALVSYNSRQYLTANVVSVTQRTDFVAIVMLWPSAEYVDDDGALHYVPDLDSSPVYVAWPPSAVPPCGTALSILLRHDAKRVTLSDHVYDRQPKGSYIVRRAQQASVNTWSLLEQDYFDLDVDEIPHWEREFLAAQVEALRRR
jgi:hypothetical protein